MMIPKVNCIFIGKYGECHLLDDDWKKDKWYWRLLNFLVGRPYCVEVEHVLASCNLKKEKIKRPKYPPRGQGKDIPRGRWCNGCPYLNFPICDKYFAEGGDDHGCPFAVVERKFRGKKRIEKINICYEENK